MARIGSATDERGKSAPRAERLYLALVDIPTETGGTGTMLSWVDAIFTNEVRPSFISEYLTNCLSRAYNARIIGAEPQVERPSAEGTN